MLHGMAERHSLEGTVRVEHVLGGKATGLGSPQNHKRSDMNRCTLGSHGYTPWEIVKVAMMKERSKKKKKSRRFCDKQTQWRLVLSCDSVTLDSRRCSRCSNLELARLEHQAGLEGC